jgi:DNA-binding NarL/FixJ family response regulator
MGKTISILVVSGNKSDNQDQIIAQLSSQEDFNVISIVKDDADAIIKSIALKPDVIILDLRPPGLEGTDIAPLIRRRSSSSRIILMSGKDNDIYACNSLRAGISGFLVDEEDKDRLIFIIRIVHSGGYYFNPSIIDRIFNAVLLMEYYPNQPVYQLEFGQKHKSDSPFFSTTERCIVTYIALGYSDKLIAKCLHFNIGSIRNCVSSIKRKTKSKNRAHIVIFSLIHGYIQLDHFNIKDDFNRHISNDPIQ